MKAFDWYTPKLEIPQKWGMNICMRVTEFCLNFEQLTTTGVYELVTHTVKPGMMSQLEHRLQQGLPARLAEDYPQPLALWYSVFGNINLC